MNIKQIKDKIKKNNWYSQAAEIKPFYISYPWHACLDLRIKGKKIPVKYEVLWFGKNDFFTDYISKKSMREIALYYYNKQKDNRSFIKDLFNYWQKNFVAPYLKQLHYFLSKELCLYSNQTLVSLFQKFGAAYRRLWHEAIFLDAFDYYGEILLQEVLSKEDKRIAKQDLNVLLTPLASSFLQQERLALLGIAEHLLKKYKIASFILANKNYRQVAKMYPWLDKNLLEHSSQYHWLHNDYISMKHLGPRYFYKELLMLLGDKEKLKQERKFKKELNCLKKEQEELLKKYNFSQELLGTFDFFSLLSVFRDRRKGYQQMAGDLLKKFVQEFSKRADVERPEDIEDLFHWEIKDIHHIKRSIQTIQDRSKRCFYVVTAPDKFYSVKGAMAEKLHNYLQGLVRKQNSLQCRIAYPGKVKGLVKIVKGKKDFQKMEQGDILVAPNTRPEYVPIMKMAGAIITDEGGIACHAAIISRELQKPCLVGLQLATQVLHDGDLVEVDADHATVRIIKSIRRS